MLKNPDKYKHNLLSITNKNQWKNGTQWQEQEGKG